MEVTQRYSTSENLTFKRNGNETERIELDIKFTHGHGPTSKNAEHAVHIMKGLLILIQSSTGPIEHEQLKETLIEMINEIE